MAEFDMQKWLWDEVKEKIKDIKGKVCLIIEDSSLIRDRIKQVLRKLGMFEKFVEAKDGLEGFKKFRELAHVIDMVLCDVNMPHLGGIKFVEAVKNFTQKLFSDGKIEEYLKLESIPIILITSSKDSRAKIEGLSKGANDFIYKPTESSDWSDFEQELVARVKNHLHTKKLYEAVWKSSIQDPLTKLLNRRYFYFALSRELARIQRNGGIISVAMIDLDDFKKINDTWGHSKGDEILVGFSEVLRSTIRSYDIAGRFGGDEFIIGLPDTKPEGAMAMCRRIKENLQKKGINISFSAGISFYPSFSVTSVESLIKNADLALYEAKRKGKGNVEIYRDRSGNGNISV